MPDSVLALPGANKASAHRLLEFSLQALPLLLNSLTQVLDEMMKMEGDKEMHRFQASVLSVFYLGPFLA